MNGRAIVCWSIVAAGVLLMSGSAASAASDPIRRVSSWQSVGMVEMQLPLTVVRITLFSNDELLAEIVVEGTAKRMLRLRPSGSELYFGLSESELPLGKNPFMFFDLAFAAVLIPLDQAFPEGPSTVPVVAVTREGVADRKHFVLVAERSEAGRILCRVTWDGLDEPVSGVIDIARPPPWAGTVPVAEWQTRDAVRFDVLERARAKP
jgi:hypothetical protein